MRNGGGREWAEFFALCDRADQARVILDGVVAPVDGIFEVDGDLE
jgi:hypothetical protein